MTTLASTAEIRGGFTMADLDRLAGVAARRHGGVTDFDDRYDAAWFGVVTALYAAEETPTERDLLFAGIQAVQRNADERNRAHGRSHRHGYEYGSAPAFAKFWNDKVISASPEGPVVERVALAQALATLTREQYEALAAVAVSPSLAAAAEAIGLTYAQLLRRYYAARDQVRALWLEGETPRGRRDDACGSGHRKAEHEATSPSGHRYCRECQRAAKALRKRRAA